MKLNKTTARLTLGLGCLLAALYLRLNEASAQHDMQSMPGMSATPAPTATASAASPTPSPSPSATPTGKPADPAMPGHDVSSMPGMSPASSPAAKPAEGAAAGAHDMSNMPGMKPAGESAKKEMSGMPAGHDMSCMPGMKDSGSKKKGGMPGMSGMSNMGGAPSGPPQVAAPGVRVLGPDRKWRPGPGEDRSSELEPLNQLKEHLEPLPPPIAEPILRSFTITELLEYQLNSAGPDTFRWDIVGWLGTDEHRLWYKTEGSQQLGGDETGEADLELLYGRLIAPFWDFQIGARASRGLGTGSADTRTYAVIGVQGLTPYMFEVEPSLYISDQGQISASFTGSFDLLLTQRLVLQPRFEATAAIQSDEKFGVGEGLNETELGVRLRYEIAREIAPYVGVSWVRQYGETARFAREEGEPTDSIALVAGLRLWW